MSAVVERGRVLLVGGKDASTLRESLALQGFTCTIVESAEEGLRAAASLRPDAIYVTRPVRKSVEVLAALRAVAELKDVPVLVDANIARSLGDSALLHDDVVHRPEELTRRVDAAMRARKMMEREARARLRMEMLLEITQAATSSLELDEVLRLAVVKVAEVVNADRCSVVLVEGDSTRSARVVASAELPGFQSLRLDLARYPELRRVLETRQALHVEDAMSDPLMAEVRQEISSLGVRSIFIQPLICQDDLLGALFLRVRQENASFGREDREFAQAVAGALSNSLRNARLHTALRRKREDLESAYVDRYRELGDANRRLKELNRLKDELIAVCSHDLRAPLQILLGHSRLLVEGDLAPQQLSSVDAIHRQGRKILAMVESLLDKGKGEQARFSLDPKQLDVSELCREAVAEFEILAAEKGVSLRASCDGRLDTIADPVKLHEVLQNLLSNAISHAQTGGEVWVRATRLDRPDGDVARVVVQDDGAGIPEQELHLVFDRYRHGPKGTGLGLAICKEFVELHGGEIWAEAPGRGCALVFTLPLARAESNVATLTSLPRRPVGEQARVLVVEDEPEIAAVLCEVLRSRYRVELARDGAEGLAKARALHPDLIVMDVFLPKLDGLDAAVALKNSTDTAAIPVILLSAHQGVADKVRALNLGAVDYMGKPFQALELLSRVDRALRLHATERDLERSRSMLRQGGSDPSTGLIDAAGLEARLTQEISRALRYGRPLSGFGIRLKEWSEPTLRRTAAVLKEQLRVADVMAHCGEGLFIVLMPEVSEEGARAVQVRVIIELQRALGDKPTGMVTLIGSGDSPEKVVERLTPVPLPARKPGS